MKKTKNPYEVNVNYDSTPFHLVTIISLQNFKTFVFVFQHIIDSMKDPSIVAFWLITMPQIMGGFKYDDEVKHKI